jgi:hypothetical protein
MGEAIEIARAVVLGVCAAAALGSTIYMTVRLLFPRRPLRTGRPAAPL